MIETITVNPVSSARDLGLPQEQVKVAFELLEEGFPVPFIARYRKDQTGGLGESELAKIAIAYQKQRQLCDRKFSYLKTIEAQGRLTPELEKQIREARSPRRLDDLYLPFRSKRASLAQTARTNGLDPLAMIILNATDESRSLEDLAAPFVAEEKGVATTEDALKGAADIIAENFSESFELRRAARDAIQRFGRLVTKKVENATEEQNAQSPEAANENIAQDSEVANVSDANSEEIGAVAEDSEKKKTSVSKSAQQLATEKLFSEYFDANFSLRACFPHRILEINRGEGLKVISASFEIDEEELKKTVRPLLVEESRPYASFLNRCVDDCLSNIAIPALAAEARAELTARAEEQTSEVLFKNLRNLLMRRPVVDRRVLAIFTERRNSRLAALDASGALLDSAAVSLVGSADKREAGVAKMVEMIEKFDLNVIAIYRGFGQRDIEAIAVKLIEEKFADKDVSYAIVECADSYSYANSQLAKEELPDCDSATRCAVSLGRRLQDPLAEYVKFDAERLGGALCRYELRPKLVKETYANALASCVNAVGFDLNNATPSSLRYVAGLNQLTGKRVYDFRQENGPYQTREQLKGVSGLGSAATYCMGFVKIVGGTNPLDATWIHPESYDLATRILEKLGFVPAGLFDSSKRDQLVEKVQAANPAALAEEFQAGVYTVTDILNQFVKPGSDPRDDSPAPVFKKGTMKLEDLKPGMELQGTVLRVVEFGAFVDIGANEVGLLHSSNFGRSFVHDASRRVSVGDVFPVWVLRVDLERRHIALAAFDPDSDSERRPERRSERPRPRRDFAANESKREGMEGQERKERRDHRDRRYSDKSAQTDGSEREVSQRSRRDSFAHDHKRGPRTFSAPTQGKKIVPISDAMKSGKEPLRSFSDLAQLFGRVKADDQTEKK